MKKNLIYLLLAGVLIFSACEVGDPTQPQITTIKRDQLALTKIVFIGNSLTAGFQSGGLVEDLQANSFPALIYRQMGQGGLIEQPLVGNPGISSTPGVGVLDFNPATGAISPRGTYTDVTALLMNATVARPYDNLGVPGARLTHLLNAYDAATGGGNPFFNLILRNPNFGNMTQVDQAKSLNPTIVVVWAGNNDVLGAALSGGDPNLITPAASFQTDYIAMIQQLGTIENLVGILAANIPNVTDIPYVNLLDGLIYKDVTLPGVGSVNLPVVFDDKFQPVPFPLPTGDTLYLPLLTQEGIMGGGVSPVKHILLPFLSKYKTEGLGVPDSTWIANTLIAFGFTQAQASVLAQTAVDSMIANDLTPSGDPITGDLTITADEEAVLLAAVTGFNQIIAGVAGSAGIPVIDANAMLSQLNSPAGIEGYSGKFVFFDPAATAFSLDGVHPNNGGYAIIANEFIKVINSFSDDINIPLVDTQQFKGQYTGGAAIPKSITYKAALQAKAIFTDY